MHALEVMKKVGNIWQKLGSKEKQRFEDEAQIDKQRFLREIRIFKKELDSTNDTNKESQEESLQNSKVKSAIKTTNTNPMDIEMKEVVSESSNVLKSKLSPKKTEQS